MKDVNEKILSEFLITNQMLYRVLGPAIRSYFLIMCGQPDKINPKWLNLSQFRTLIEQEFEGKSIEVLREKRDNEKLPPQTRTYYHNEICKLFENAEKIAGCTSFFTPNLLKVNNEDILSAMENLRIKREEYEVDTYLEKIDKEAHSQKMKEVWSRRKAKSVKGSDLFVNI